MNYNKLLVLTKRARYLFAYIFLLFLQFCFFWIMWHHNHAVISTKGQIYVILTAMMDVDRSLFCFLLYVPLIGWIFAYSHFGMYIFHHIFNWLINCLPWRQVVVLGGIQRRPGWCQYPLYQQWRSLTKPAPRKVVVLGGTRRRPGWCKDPLLSIMKIHDKTCS